MSAAVRSRTRRAPGLGVREPACRPLLGLGLAGAGVGQDLVGVPLGRLAGALGVRLGGGEHRRRLGPEPSGLRLRLGDPVLALGRRTRQQRLGALPVLVEPGGEVRMVPTLPVPGLGLGRLDDGTDRPLGPGEVGVGRLEDGVGLGPGPALQLLGALPGLLLHGLAEGARGLLGLGHRGEPSGCLLLGPGQLGGCRRLRLGALLLGLRRGPLAERGELGMDEGMVLVDLAEPGRLVLGDPREDGVVLVLGHRDELGRALLGGGHLPFGLLHGRGERLVGGLRRPGPQEGRLVDRVGEDGLGLLVGLGEPTVGLRAEGRDLGLEVVEVHRGAGGLLPHRGRLGSGGLGLGGGVGAELVGQGLGPGEEGESLGARLGDGWWR